MLLSELTVWAQRQDRPFSELLAQAIFNLDLLGRAQIFEDVKGEASGVRRPLTPNPLPLTKSGVLAAVVLEPSFEPLPFQEAIDFFRNKVNISPSRFETLSADARIKAFTIADGARAQVRDSIKELLDQALSEGLTLDEFKQQAAAVLDSAGVSARTPWYWETVYRTNLSTAYQAGRWQQMTDPDVVSSRPYLRYVSALLPTSRPSHREKHGVILRYDDPFWDTWYPPNGFNCYCTVTSVSESLLKRRGWKVSTGQRFVYEEPDEGFEKNVGKTA